MTDKKDNKIIITHCTEYSEKELWERMKNVSMLKAPDIFPYTDVTMTLEKLDTRGMVPSQRYVLSDGIKKIQNIQFQLAEHGIDIYDMKGFVRMWVEGQDEPIDIMPIVIEESIERDGKVCNIINDGMHRTYNAYLSGMFAKVIFIRGVSKDLPYYAYPTPSRSLDDVEIVDSLPEGYIKKWHRIENNKSLYRNFEATGAFLNVGGPRGNTK